MSFTPVDAALCFVFASIFVGAAAALLMRMKEDWLVWAGLTAASMPPAIYFAVRLGGDLATVAEVVAIIGAAWAVMLGAIWVRQRLDAAVQGLSPHRWNIADRGATRPGEGGAFSRPLGRAAGSSMASSRRPDVVDGGVLYLTDPARIGAHPPERAPNPAGYVLIGFGISIAAPCGLVFRFLFLPGRHGPPPLPLQVDHPAFVISVGGFALGALLTIVGNWALHREPTRTRAPSR